MMESEGSPKKRMRLENPDGPSEQSNDLFADGEGDAEQYHHGESPRATVDQQEDEAPFLASQLAQAPWKQWSVEEVAQKLLESGIPEDAVQKFRDHGIKGKVLDQITEDHIKNALQISELGTVLEIQKFLKSLGVRDFNDIFPDGLKIFNDPVHGHMEFHPLCVAIIDTPQFQRLRYLKQLGACYFVYPGASHNRFEHSLGVCHLAGLLVNALRKRQPLLGITKEDILCVQIAGLCHDLGHGPFSHMFDNMFIPFTRPDRKEWKHEQASIEMFDCLVKANELEPVFEKYGITEAHRVFIKEQISGKQLTKTDTGDMTYYCGTDKAFLYEIVANKRNGVDVDKWDYFKRDCYHLGMSSGFDHMRFIHFARVIKVGKELQICVRDKEVFNMYEMFHTRHALHRRAYQHRVVQAVEIMLVEAMKEAEKAQSIRIPGENGKRYKMSECIDHMDAYTNLTDSIFHLILLSDSDDVKLKPEEKLALKRAQAILQDIQKRKLYKCVGETEPITADSIVKKDGEVIKQEILAELSDQQDDVKRLGLGTTRFVVQVAKLDFGKKDENPVDALRFFSKDDQNKAKAVSAKEVSVMIPRERFKEQLVRLFLRPVGCVEADEECRQLLFEGFELWCDKHHLKKPKELLTPSNPGTLPMEDYTTPDRPTGFRAASAMKARQSLSF